MQEVKQILVVAVGGALGSVARYKLGGVVLHLTEAWQFPISTFCVNIAGCLVIGVIGALAEHHDLFSSLTRLLLFTGILGGFTTFSAFGYETMYLLRRGLIQVALLYVLFSTVGGIAAVFSGMKLVDLFWPAQH